MKRYSYALANVLLTNIMFIPPSYPLLPRTLAPIVVHTTSRLPVRAVARRERGVQLFRMSHRSYFCIQDVVYTVSSLILHRIECIWMRDFTWTSRFCHVKLPVKACGSAHPCGITSFRCVVREKGKAATRCSRQDCWFACTAQREEPIWHSATFITHSVSCNCSFCCAVVARNRWGNPFSLSGYILHIACFLLQNIGNQAPDNSIPIHMRNVDHQGANAILERNVAYENG